MSLAGLESCLKLVPKDFQTNRLNNFCRLRECLKFWLPLLVQVRKRSKACRAGLQEADELVSINEQPCGTLSHAQAMDLIDSSTGILHIRVKRSEKQKNYTLTIDKPSSTHCNGSRNNYIIHKSTQNKSEGLTNVSAAKILFTLRTDEIQI